LIRTWFESLLILLLLVAVTPSDVAAGPRCCGLPRASDGPVSGWPRLQDADDDEVSDDAKKADDDESDGESDDEKDKWDVQNPPYAYHDVTIDTDQGTWMNLDVSPDGRFIAFDLLGDIYEIPISGGEAKSLTRGIAWDMQPRYSPDGARIAFTSDRGGGDNIWVLIRDSDDDPEQVTDEDFRLVNAPAWEPGGEFIVARKHFTSRRSIGAGEMWLYHVSGGEGVQMTEKPNEQKDVNEPIFSPDGRYLYYSQDATPGKTFAYNKDSNKQIYVINRLDRETGETVQLVTGPGGAVRPAPSPDGKSLAFVRRVRFKTCFFILDIESGYKRELYCGLDRDMQEAWAIHGVYPQMAWTPDNKSIVFWAGGKIQRIDVMSGDVTAIPFHVADTRAMADAIRFPVEVAPESFDVKMLRWVRVSPSGDRVVYQALGHLYFRDLPEGTPRRLTGQTDHFEYYPSFSRDGKWIVYTTFDDQELGTVRVVSASGGDGRIVSDKPGHYVEPCISPDGNTIVYRRADGGWLRSPRWSRDQGVYRVPFEGGESTLITKQGSMPQFGKTGDRVFLLDVEREEKQDKRSLISIDLDGSDERTHLVSKGAVEYSLSPDEKWVAFVEGFNAYIAPFVRAGKSFDIGPKSKGVPVAKVSRDAGTFLHWSGDSARLHWSLGPELFTRDLTEAFKFIEGAPEELPDPPEAGVNISFTADSDVPDGKIALLGARIITMNKGGGNDSDVIEDGAILVDRNRIVAVGKRGDVDVPANALTVDCQGMTIMPGIVDVHAHGAQGTDGFIPEQNWGDFASLAFGRTTIHDPSNDTMSFFAAAELARAGEITAPRLYSTGTILYGAAGWFKAKIETLEDAESHLRRLKAVGAFSVKSYNQPRRDQRQKVIQAARDLNMMVVPEGGSLYQHNMSMVIDGHTGIEHCLPVAEAYGDVFQLWAQSKTGYTPTMVVGYGGLTGETYWYSHTNVWENERLNTFVPRFVIDPNSRRRELAPDEEYNHFNVARLCKKFLDKGVCVNLGAHGQLAGIDAHWELWMFEQGGMTPLDALQCATINGAKYIGMDGDIGSIEKGKLADLVVLEADPLESIRNSEAIRYTMINGRLYDAKTMNEVGNHPRERQPFFWKYETK